MSEEDKAFKECWKRAKYYQEKCEEFKKRIAELEKELDAPIWESESGKEWVNYKEENQRLREALVYSLETHKWLRDLINMKQPQAADVWEITSAINKLQAALEGRDE